MVILLSCRHDDKAGAESNTDNVLISDFLLQSIIKYQVSITQGAL